MTTIGELWMKFTMRSTSIRICIVPLFVLFYTSPHTCFPPGEECDMPERVVNNFVLLMDMEDTGDFVGSNDVEKVISYYNDSRVSVQARIYLSDGKVRGISKAVINGKIEEYCDYRLGHKCSIRTKFVYPRIRVEYNKVDIFTSPEQGIQADSYEGYFYGIEARVTVQCDEDTGLLKLEYYRVSPSSFESAEFELVGAEDIYVLSNNLVTLVSNAVPKLMRKRMLENVEMYNENVLL